MITTLPKSIFCNSNHNDEKAQQREKLLDFLRRSIDLKHNISLSQFCQFFGELKVKLYHEKKMELLKAAVH